MPSPNRRLRLTFISAPLGYLNRGSETFVHDLANQLSKSSIVSVLHAGPAPQDHQYLSFHLTLSPPPISHLHHTHLLNRLFITPARLWQLLFYLLSLPRLLATRPDFVFPTSSGWNTPLYKLASIIFGFKLIIIGHSGPGWDDHWNLLWHPTAFIALTNSQFDWAKRFASTSTHLVHIPGGIDFRQFKTAAHVSLNLPKPLILSVGALEANKNLDLTIRAVAKLKSASLLILGSGPQLNYLNRLGNKLLGSKRFLIKAVSHQQMSAYYHAATIFTLCSHSREAFGLSYLEALASGLACVATADPSRREIIGPAGLYVSNPHNAAQYAQVLQRALERHWGTLPLRQAAKFSWGIISTQYLKLFKTLIKLAYNPESSGNASR